MINRLVSFALSQRFLIIMTMFFLMIWGIISFQKLPIDAYPDLSPPHVQIITQWPGHAAEEVERLITIPIELEMNGIPQLQALRSISLYGLSSVQMNFQYDTDPYFVREQSFERLPNAQVPAGIQPALAPLFSPSGLIYRYVLQSPDRTPQELKTFEDWVVERHYRAIQGVADDSGFGGTTMQYHVLLDPNKLLSYNVTLPQVVQQLGNNNANAGGGFFSSGGQFFYVRGLGLLKTPQDIGNIVIATHNGVPTYVRDVGRVMEPSLRPARARVARKGRPRAVPCVLTRKLRDPNVTLKGFECFYLLLAEDQIRRFPATSVTVPSQHRLILKVEGGLGLR